MPGDSPGEAVKAFHDPIKTAVSVVGSSHLGFPTAHPEVGAYQTATLNHGEGVKCESTLYGSVLLRATFVYVVIECDPGDPRGPYRCSTRSYIHSLLDADGLLLIAFHWHPESSSPDRAPHMHIGNGRVPQTGELHVPTPRISVEHVVITAVDSFGVVAPPDDEWRPLLEDSNVVHERWRNWHSRADAPQDFT